MGVRLDEPRRPRTRRQPGEHHLSESQLLAGVIGFGLGGALILTLGVGADWWIDNDQTITKAHRVEVERVPDDALIVRVDTPLTVDGVEYQCDWQGKPGGEVDGVVCEEPGDDNG